MKNTAKEWLTGRASLSGMLACGLRGPDGKFVCHSLEATFPAPAVETMLGYFDGQRSELFSNPPVPRWCTWVFEGGQVRFVPRPDGWLLGLVVRLGSEAVPRLDALSIEFLSLELEG